jgi:hypothetical protein
VTPQFFAGQWVVSDDRLCCCRNDFGLLAGMDQHRRAPGNVDLARRAPRFLAGLLVESDHKRIAATFVTLHDYQVTVEYW